MALRRAADDGGRRSVLVGRRRPVVHDAIAHVACTLWDEHEAGDHTLYLGEVAASASGRGTRWSPTAARSADRAEPALADNWGWGGPPRRGRLTGGDGAHRRGRGDPLRAALPPSRALRVGRVERADNVLVRIHTDAGWSATPRCSPALHLRRDAGVDRRGGPGLARLRLLGMRPGWGSELRGARGVRRVSRATYCARGAVDVALWDLLRPAARGCRARRCSAGTPTVWRSRTC